MHHQPVHATIISKLHTAARLHDDPRAPLQEVQHFLMSGSQAPAMRTSYRRMAFQQHDSNAVRVSLDTEVVMVGVRQVLPV